MNDGMYYQLAKIEDNHWWFVYRRQLIHDLLSPIITNKLREGLDIGCGTGGNIPLLKYFCSKVIGLDRSKIALTLARKKKPKDKFILGNANDLNKIFSPNNFGLITIFNVLYHQWINNELKIIKQTYNILKPGGYLVITEPAFKFLKRKHDILDLGKTRYQLSSLKKLISKTGFIIIKETYFNSLSFIPALFLALIEQSFNKNKKITVNLGADELRMPNILINNFLQKLMSVERKIIIKGGRIPLGVSLLIIAQKSQNLNNKKNLIY